MNARGSESEKQYTFDILLKIVYFLSIHNWTYSYSKRYLNNKSHMIIQN